MMRVSAVLVLVLCLCGCHNPAGPSPNPTATPVYETQLMFNNYTTQALSIYVDNVSYGPISTGSSCSNPSSVAIGVAPGQHTVNVAANPVNAPFFFYANGYGPYSDATVTVTTATLTPPQHGVNVTCDGTGYALVTAY